MDQRVLRHAIQKTLYVCAKLIESKRAPKLLTLVRDENLVERASGLILNNMLREMVPNEEPTPKQYRRLLDEIADLANES